MKRKMGQIEKVDYNSVAKIISELVVTNDEERDLKVKYDLFLCSGNCSWKTGWNDENMTQWKFCFEERVWTRSFITT